MRLSIILVMVFAFMFLPSYSFAQCSVTGEYTAIIIEDGLFTGKIKSFKLKSIVDSDGEKPLPAKWARSRVKTVRQQYGDDLCKVNNPGFEFYAIDKYNKSFIVFPSTIEFECQCD